MYIGLHVKYLNNVRTKLVFEFDTYHTVQGVPVSLPNGLEAYCLR